MNMRNPQIDRIEALEKWIPKSSEKENIERLKKSNITKGKAGFSKEIVFRDEKSTSKAGRKAVRRFWNKSEEVACFKF